MKSKPTNIDEYLATVGPDRRSALEKLRKTIHALVPCVEECISYSMPAFRCDGRVIGGFLATKAGCSFYPFSGTTLRELATELAGYEQTKSALHFDAKKGLPRALVKKLVDTRMAEVSSRRTSRDDR